MQALHYVIGVRLAQVGNQWLCPSIHWHEISSSKLLFILLRLEFLFKVIWSKYNNKQTDGNEVVWDLLLELMLLLGGRSKLIGRVAIFHQQLTDFQYGTQERHLFSSRIDLSKWSKVMTSVYACPCVYVCRHLCSAFVLLSKALKLGYLKYLKEA